MRTTPEMQKKAQAVHCPNVEGFPSSELQLFKNQYILAVFHCNLQSNSNRKAHAKPRELL